MMSKLLYSFVFGKQKMHSPLIAGAHLENPVILAGLGCRRWFAVYLRCQFFAGFEGNGSAGSDLNGLAGLGVATLAGLLFAGDEVAKSAQVNLFTLGKRTGNFGDKRFYHGLGIFLRMPCGG
jgi:hypothetical protein